MVYDNYKIYGPYISKKDNRLRIIAVKPNGKKITISYPKYLMEKHFNRYLNNNETVDHIDSNYQNNEISNLRILNLSEHIKTDVRRLKQQSFMCLMCENKFHLDGKRLCDAILYNIKKQEP
jgi:hypothetical protein